MAANNEKQAFDYGRQANPAGAKAQQKATQGTGYVNQESLNQLAQSVKELGTVIAQEVSKGLDEATTLVGKSLNVAA